MGHIFSHIRLSGLRVNRYLLVANHLCITVTVGHLKSLRLINHTSGEKANGFSLELQKSRHWVLANTQKDKCKAIHCSPRTEPRLQDQWGVLESRKNSCSDGGWPILSDLTTKHVTEGRGFSKNKKKLSWNNWSSAWIYKWILIYTNIVTKLDENYKVQDHKIYKANLNRNSEPLDKSKSFSVWCCNHNAQ